VVKKTRRTKGPAKTHEFGNVHLPELFVGAFFTGRLLRFAFVSLEKCLIYEIAIIIRFSCVGISFFGERLTRNRRLKESKIRVEFVEQFHAHDFLLRDQ
jgi:hypothetical protein